MPLAPQILLFPSILSNRLSAIIILTVRAELFTEQPPTSLLVPFLVHQICGQENHPPIFFNARVASKRTSESVCDRYVWI